MAATHVLSAAPAGGTRRVLWLRIGIVAGILVAWQALAMSGLLFRDVVPGLGAMFKALTRVAPLKRGTVTRKGDDLVVD